MKQRVFRFLADLRFAIFILILISIISILGTIIEQDQPIETYKLNYPLGAKLFGILSWKLILQLGLDHVYQTWWFYSLCIIFAASLSLCTFLQQFPALKIAQRCQFFRLPKSFIQLKFSRNSGLEIFNKSLRYLRKTGYSFFQQKNTIYCYKGLIGRIAPIFVHFSLILVLFGTLVSSVIGFKAQEIVPKSEIFYIQNIFNTGQLTNLPKQSARINDFWITYTSKKTINQFYSDISLLNKNGNEIERHTCFVNTPFIYRGNYYYQTDWNLVGLRLKDLNQKLIEYPLISLHKNTKVWISWISFDSTFKNGVLVLIDNLNGYCSIYDKTGKFLGNLESHEAILNMPKFQLIEILSSTGLQIKSDPGIPIIYIGFFFLILSVFVSYITYSQIWIIKFQNELFIGGTTTRDLFKFEFEFENIKKQ